MEFVTQEIHGSFSIWIEFQLSFKSMEVTFDNLQKAQHILWECFVFDASQTEEEICRITYYNTMNKKINT